MGCRCSAVERIPVLRLLLWALVLGVGVSGPAWGFRNVEEGQEIPAFQLTSLGGSSVTASSLRGKGVVLAFVRQGQPKSLEVLRELARQAQAEDAQVEYLGIVTNPQEGDAVQWSAEVNAIISILSDTDGEAYGAFGVLVTPSTGVVDPAGKFVGELSGYRDGYGDEVQKLVRVALGLEEPVEEGAEEAAAAVVEEKSDARKSAERSLERARMLGKRKMKDKAVGVAEEAVAADGDYTAARIFLADLLLDMSDDNAPRAQEQYQRVLELEPKSDAAQIGLARVKSIQGEHEQAAQMLSKAAMLNPRPEKIYYELGRVEERAGNHAAAAAAYRKALERLLE